MPDLIIVRVMIMFHMFTQQRAEAVMSDEQPLIEW